MRYFYLVHFKEPDAVDVEVHADSEEEALTKVKEIVARECEHFEVDMYEHLEGYYDK